MLTPACKSRSCTLQCCICLLPRLTKQLSAGMPQRHITYAVESQSGSLELRIPSGTTVRRRFSDFVALERLLRCTHRGHFIPPRPLKHAGKISGKLKDTFVEKRRLSLELYLQRVAAHPCAAHGFLFCGVHDAACQNWMQTPLGVGCLCSQTSTALQLAMLAFCTGALQCSSLPAQTCMRGFVRSAASTLPLDCRSPASTRPGFFLQ